MRICFIADARSVHTQRWVRWFGELHDVGLIATVADESLAEVCIGQLSAPGRVRGTRLVESIRTTRALVARFAPDIVHGHFINEAGWFAAASGSRPLVISAWGSDLYRAPHESRVARRLNPWAVRRANWVTCDSQDQARVLRTWGVANDRLSVVGWGVDRREFHPAVDGRPLRLRLGIPLQAPVVLSPRQWLPNSNIVAIVAAHAQLGNDVHLLLKRQPRLEHGAGAAVEAAVRASPARDRVHVINEIAADELPEVYAAADVVASLCTTDGTPLSVLEAMALGRPVVALATASVAEWVSPPGGLIVHTLHPEEVGGAIEACLRPAARARAAAHNVAIVASRADRVAEMGRVAAGYERLVSVRTSKAV